MQISDFFRVATAEAEIQAGTADGRAYGTPG